MQDVTGGDVYRIQHGALEALQEAAEAYMVRSSHLFCHGYLLLTMAPVLQALCSELSVEDSMMMIIRV